MSIINRIHSYREVDPEYAGVLFTALQVIGEEALGKALDEAETQGKQLRLASPIPFELGPSEPNGVEIAN